MLSKNVAQNCIMTPEESRKQVKIIDKKIEQFAQYLQRKNNLDHIQF